MFKMHYFFLISGLLKSVAAKGMEGKPLPAPVVYERQDPATAPDLVKYLWYKVYRYTADIPEIIVLYTKTTLLDLHYKTFYFFPLKKCEMHIFMYYYLVRNFANTLYYHYRCRGLTRQSSSGWWMITYSTKTSTIKCPSSARSTSFVVFVCFCMYWTV